MARGKFSSETKVKAVLELLREERTISEIAADYRVSPNQLRNWRKEFMDKVPSIFEPNKERGELQKAEKAIKTEREALYRQIGQVTFERDYLKKKGTEIWGAEFLDDFPGKQ
jgi:transposase-like protein